MCDCQQTTAVQEAALSLPIPADQVTFDNTLGLLPPGTDNVQEAIEELASAPPPTLPEMTPSVRGSAFGLTRSPPDSSDGVTSIGYQSLDTYSAQTPNGLVSATTVCGSASLVNLDQNAVSLVTENNLIGNSLFFDVGPISVMAGVNVMGGPIPTNGLIELTNSNLIGMGTVFDNLVFGRNTVRNASCMVTAQSTFDSADLEQGFVLIGNTGCLDMTEQSIVIGAGNQAELNSQPGILLTQGIQPFNNQNFQHCCTLLGSINGEPNSDNQFVATHSSFRMQNIGIETPTGNADWLVFYNASTGRFAPASPLGNIRRVFSSVQTTNASGDVTLNYAALGLSLVPNVTATVRNASGTVFYGCKTTAVSATSWTGRVFQSVNVVLASPSMVPSGAGILVDISVAY